MIKTNKPHKVVPVSNSSTKIPKKYNIHLGLCCINETLRKHKPSVFCSRTVTRKNYTVKIAKTLAMQNVLDMRTMIQWNYDHGIDCFRLSSNIFPRFTDTEVSGYSIDFCKSQLAENGRLAKQYGQRILMHPGQFNQVGAVDESVFASTVADLQHHADILDHMKIVSMKDCSIRDRIDSVSAPFSERVGILIVHGGGVYNDKQATIERWIDQFDDLPKSVKQRLAIENDERHYSVQDALAIAQACDIPLVYDHHHHDCYCQLHGLDERDVVKIFPDVISTWNGTVPVMHLSSQKKGARLGSHSKYIDKIPELFLELIDLIPNKHVDVEVEAKAKEAAIFDLWGRYPKLFPDKQRQILRKEQ